MEQIPQQPGSGSGSGTPLKHARTASSTASCTFILSFAEHSTNELALILRFNFSPSSVLTTVLTFMRRSNLVAAKIENVVLPPRLQRRISGRLWNITD